MIFNSKYFIFLYENPRYDFDSETSVLSPFTNKGPVVKTKGAPAPFKTWWGQAYMTSVLICSPTPS